MFLQRGHSNWLLDIAKSKHGSYAYIECLEGLEICDIGSHLMQVLIPILQKPYVSRCLSIFFNRGMVFYFTLSAGW